MSGKLFTIIFRTKNVIWMSQQCVCVFFFDEIVMWNRFNVRQLTKQSLVSFIAVRISQTTKSINFFFILFIYIRLICWWNFLGTIHLQSLALNSLLFFYIDTTIYFVYSLAALFFGLFFRWFVSLALYRTLLIFLRSLARIFNNRSEFTQIDYYRFDSAAQLNSNRTKKNMWKRSKFVVQKSVCYLMLCVCHFFFSIRVCFFLFTVGRSATARRAPHLMCSFRSYSWMNINSTNRS